MAFITFRRPGRRPRRKLAAQSGPINITLNAGPGSSAFSGKANLFAIMESGSAGVLAPTGITQPFTIAQTATFGPFALSGIAVVFRSVEPVAAGTHLFSGIVSTASVRELVTPIGSLAFTGAAARFSVAISPSASAYPLAGFASDFRRDLEAWVRRPFGFDEWNSAATQVEGWTRQPLSTGAWDPTLEPGTSWTAVAGQPKSWTKNDASSRLR